MGFVFIYVLVQDGNIYIYDISSPYSHTDKDKYSLRLRILESCIYIYISTPSFYITLLILLHRSHWYSNTRRPSFCGLGAAKHKHIPFVTGLTFSMLSYEANVKFDFSLCCAGFQQLPVDALAPQKVRF